MDPRPNLIFIVADDLGYADLGCYGGRDAEFGAGVAGARRAWPRDGLRFTQGYSNSPVCSPTRFALMTGALAVPAARRGRGADQQQEPRQHHAGPAARAPDAALAAARRRLPHRADRQVAPGLSAGLRAAALGLRGVLRADGGRRRLLHPCRFGRPARPVRRRRPSSPRDGYLTDLITQRARGLGAAHGRRAGALLPEPALHRAALAVGDARRPRAGARPEGQPVPPGTAATSTPTAA